MSQSSLFCRGPKSKRLDRGGRFVTWKESIFPCHLPPSGIWEYRNQPTIDTWYASTKKFCLNTHLQWSGGPRELGLHWIINTKRLFDCCMSRNRIPRIILGQFIRNTRMMQNLKPWRGLVKTSAQPQVLFTKSSVITFDQDGKAILVGWQETTGPRLRHWPLLPQLPMPTN